MYRYLESGSVRHKQYYSIQNEKMKCVMYNTKTVRDTNSNTYLVWVKFLNSILLSAFYKLLIKIGPGFCDTSQ